MIKRIAKLAAVLVTISAVGLGMSAANCGPFANRADTHWGVAPTTLIR